MIREMAMQFVGMYIGAMLIMSVGGAVLFKITDIIEERKKCRRRLAELKREQKLIRYINRENNYGYKVRYYR